MGRPRQLGDVDAQVFLTLEPAAAMHAMLAANGYQLCGTTRPRLYPDGVVQVRLVWRARRCGGCVVNIFHLRGGLSESAFIALSDALKATETKPARARRHG